MTSTRKVRSGLRIAAGVAVLFGLLTIAAGGRALFGGPEARAAVGDDGLWRDLIERPVGQTIADTFGGDLVRGVVLTDALIGTFAPNIDDSLAANRCFLYHVIGGGTGDWDVPVGGMGAVTGELARAARLAGAELLTGAEVTAITPDGEVSYRSGDTERTLAATWVLANIAPYELERLLGAASVIEPVEIPAPSGPLGTTAYSMSGPTASARLVGRVQGVVVQARARTAVSPRLSALARSSGKVTVTDWS